MSLNLGIPAIGQFAWPWHAEDMDAYSSPSSSIRRASWMARLARRISYAVGEMNYAQKRILAVRLGYGVVESERAPDSYSEFLLRSAVVTMHEPPARNRACGRPVK
jgi:hypothetical protein